tara:strand:+ start:1109 stop:1501 length:393 start_codon:yes stop_codon:yes gene_type:complete
MLNAVRVCLLLLGLFFVSGCSESREDKYLRLQDELAEAVDKEMVTRLRILEENRDHLIDDAIDRDESIRIKIDKYVNSKERSESERRSAAKFYQDEEFRKQVGERRFPELTEVQQQISDLKRQINAMEKT